MSCWWQLICLSTGLVAVPACNVFDHELHVVPGAGLDARAGVDAAPPVDSEPGADAARACDLARPFANPVLVDGVASTSLDACMRLSPDERTAYFFSARSGRQLLYTAHRAQVTDPFSDVVALANVNSGEQYNPAISADGLTLLFASFRAGGVGDNDIYLATRNAGTDDFVNQRVLPNVNTLGSEVQPYVTHDSTTLYFVRTVASRATIFRAIGSVTGGFLDPAAVPEVAGPTNDSDPVQAADGLTLYWASDRPGGRGDLDVWQAQRSSLSEPFRDPAPVASVNELGLDAPSDVSEDGCRLYLTSTRGGRTGIYVATRPQ